MIDRKGVVHPVEQIYRDNLGEDSVTVYNFKVEDDHTYFVGETYIWVHNANCVGANGTQTTSKQLGKTEKQRE